MFRQKVEAFKVHIYNTLRGGKNWRIIKLKNKINITLLKGTQEKKLNVT